MMLFDGGRIRLGMESLHRVINLFFQATGMDISAAKSSFHHNVISSEILLSIQSCLHFQMEAMENGFKYLGFFLKPNGYHKED